MLRTLLKSKIHRVAVTHGELDYEGSCAIGENLLEAAHIAENEQIPIWNINKGERGSGMISINGSAARRASASDLLIITAFAQMHDGQMAAHSSQLVFVGDNNRQTELRRKVPTQLL